MPNRRRGISPATPIDWPAPEQRSRAVRHYLAALDEAEPVGATAQEPRDDPGGCRLEIAAPGRPAFYAYSTNYLALP